MVSLKMVVVVFLALVLPFIAPTFAFSPFQNKSCCYGAEVFENGDVIASFPDQCMQLFCNNSKAEPRYYHSPLDCHCCEFNGKMYKTGERIAAICTDITCHHGKWITKGYFDECCRRCNLRNDPHITTFDKYYYHWHGICNYSISQLDYGYNEDFGIYGAFRRCNRRASCIDQTTFTDNPHTVIEIEYNQGANVKVNDEAYVVKGFIEQVNVPGLHPVLAWRSGNCNMFLGSQGYLLETCNHQLNVWAYPNLLNDVNGLCGHYNMYQPDDFTDRMGVQRPLVTYPFIFPTCWKTSDQEKQECRVNTTTIPVGDACKATAEERKRLKDICIAFLKPVCDDDVPEFIINVAVWSCVADLCIMRENGATEIEIELWVQEMKNMHKVNCEIEIKTTVGGNPPAHDDHDDDHDHSSCGSGGCGNQFHVENHVQLVLHNPGGTHLH